MAEKGNHPEQELEGRQEREIEVKGEEGEQQGTSSKIKQQRSTETNITMITSIVEEAENASIVDNNRTYSNRESRENKHGNSKAPAVRGTGSSKEPLHHGYGQEDKQELLCLWRF